MSLWRRIPTGEDKPPDLVKFKAWKNAQEAKNIINYSNNLYKKKFAPE
jgi:inorganic pyrophosphatase